MTQVDHFKRGSMQEQVGIEEVNMTWGSFSVVLVLLMHDGSRSHAEPVVQTANLIPCQNNAYYAPGCPYARLFGYWRY